MSSKVKFDREGYQKDMHDLNGSPLPSDASRQLTPEEQAALGIPTAESVADHLRSQPKRGPSMRIEQALPARARLKLNQKDFAKLIGSTTATIRNWEQGRSKIPRTAQKLMRIIHKRPDLVKELE